MTDETIEDTNNTLENEEKPKIYVPEAEDISETLIRERKFITPKEPSPEAKPDVYMFESHVEVDKSTGTSTLSGF